MTHIDADCIAGKHRACPGWVFNETTDTTTDCECRCHTQGEETT